MSGKIPAIGIDLGTTFSCVAVWQHGKVEIIPNEQGNRITPSYVAFTDTERLIGDAAKNQVVMNPENTVFDAKRLIGRKFDDPKIQDDIKLWPFKVINEGENPKIEVKFKNQKKRLTPEEISSMILSKMKEVAEAYLGGTVKDAVITVPAYFNDAQRQATKDAGTIAGLNVLRIINEPTVAALAYGLDKNLKGTKNVFVFDLGGGTFDVSIVTIYEGSQYDVRATAGDTHLGGEDFDNILVDYLVKEFKKKFSKDPSSSSKALRKLRTAAERAKRTLSSATEANIEVDALFEGIDFSTKISRARFEELCLNLFHSTIETSKQALKDATLEISSIDDIVLVGGSTRIPKIQSLLQSFFSGKTLNLSINPDEAVAYGAAVQAAILTGDQSSAIQRVLLIDVTPLSLGVEVHGGIMYVVVKRNTQTPCKLKRGLQTTRDNQTEMDILIFEGERTLTKDNNLLGKFTLSGVTPAPVGEAKVDVTYEVDDNGILVVTAEDRSSGNSKTITVKNDSGRLSKYEIDRLIRDSIRYKEEDNKEKARITARNELEIYLYKLKNLVSDNGNHLNENEKSLIKKHCAEDLEWLDSHSDANQSEFQQRLSKLKTQFSSLKTKIDQTQ